MAIENLKYHLILALLIFHIAFWQYIAIFEPCIEFLAIFLNFDRIMAIEKSQITLDFSTFNFSYSFLAVYIEFWQVF